MCRPPRRTTCLLVTGSTKGRRTGVVEEGEWRRVGRFGGPRAGTTEDTHPGSLGWVSPRGNRRDSWEVTPRSHLRPSLPPSRPPLTGDLRDEDGGRNYTLEGQEVPREPWGVWFTPLERTPAEQNEDPPVEGMWTTVVGSPEGRRGYGVRTSRGREVGSPKTKDSSTPLWVGG